MRLRRVAGAAVVATGLAACGVLAPLPRETSLDQRLAMFPTSGLPLKDQVVLYWNDRQVPFIDARNDDDLAFTLGLVHAHLRLGLMEVFRRAARGRLSELGGPLAIEIDHALRIVDFGKAAPAILADMPPDTRRWLDRFVDGVNHYVAHAERLPHEFAILGLEREPWTAEDVIAAGRLASADVNWFVWFALLGQRDRDGWPELWTRLVSEGTESFPSFFAGKSGSRAHLVDLLSGLSRSGSNSVAVAGSRSESGSALLASDPHLGISLPNLWIIAGYRSPSYHAVGLMGPGLPFIALGRNARIAWGGTNLRAASSDLFDVSALPADAFRAREERIRVRWWFDKTVTIRDTDYGPVLSDADALDTGSDAPLALRWMGHRPTDELTAMLRVNRAGDWDDFQTALSGFAVSSQNMIYADVEGNIGHLMATQLPARENGLPSGIVLGVDKAAAWERVVTTEDLPATFNPPNGVIASANNRGAVADIPIGYFFSPDDRVVRLTRLLEEAGKVSVAELAAMQRDVYQGSSAMMRDALVRRLDETLDAGTLSPAQRQIVEDIRTWDGHYRRDSRGPVAFEIFLHEVVGALVPEFERDAYSASGRPMAFFREDVLALDAERLAPAFLAALERTAQRAATFPTWGDMHRLRVAHPAAVLPVVGLRYVFDDLPMAGSSQTLFKTAHGLTDRRHNTQYGSNARHISDLGDADANYFVLLGGQDGWLRSTTFRDQIDLWQRGDYVQVPLRLETVRETFPHRMELNPGA